MKNIFAAILLVSLAACGGSGQSSVPTAKPVAASAVQPAVTIAMYGDSTTWGTTFETGVYTQSPHNEPVSLQWALQQQFGTSVTVENHGVPGATCPELLWGQAPATQSWAQAMASSDAQIVTMNCAINDAFLPNETEADFEYAYGQFAQIAHQYGKTFVIMTPNPIGDGHNSELGQLVQYEGIVANEVGVAIIDQWDNIQNTVPNWLAELPDQIHPNDDLYEYKAQYSAQGLQGAVTWYLAN